MSSMVTRKMGMADFKGLKPSEIRDKCQSYFGLEADKDTPWLDTTNNGQSLVVHADHIIVLLHMKQEGDQEIHYINIDSSKDTHARVNYLQASQLFIPVCWGFGKLRNWEEEKEDTARKEVRGHISLLYLEKPAGSSIQEFKCYYLDTLTDKKCEIPSQFTQLKSILAEIGNFSLGPIKPVFRGIEKLHDLRVPSPCSLVMMNYIRKLLGSSFKNVFPLDYYPLEDFKTDLNDTLNLMGLKSRPVRETKDRNNN